MVAFEFEIIETVHMNCLIRPIFSFSLLALLVSPLSLQGQKSQQMYGLNYSQFSGQAAPSRDLLDTLSREARWDDESGDLNPSGFRLRFVKIDEQSLAGGRSADRYRVFAEGAPEDKVFSFASWTLNQPLAYDPHDIYVNGQGLLMIHRPTPEQEMRLSAPDDELVVVLSAARAEPVRFLFSSRDHQLLISATLVPRPVKSEDRGCRLEARLAVPDASSVLLVADGFQAKAKIPLVLESEGSSVNETMTADRNGHAVWAAFPFVPGKTQGTLRATAEGPGCLPLVVLSWGPAAAPSPAEKKP